MIYIAIAGVIVSVVTLFAHIAGVCRVIKIERNIDADVLDKIRKRGR